MGLRQGFLIFVVAVTLSGKASASGPRYFGSLARHLFQPQSSCAGSIQQASTRDDRRTAKLQSLLSSTKPSAKILALAAFSDEQEYLRRTQSWQGLGFEIVDHFLRVVKKDGQEIRFHKMTLEGPLETLKYIFNEVHSRKPNGEEENTWNDNYFIRWAGLPEEDKLFRQKMLELMR